jgi:uncharacterized damage-inducible protein DinB
VTDDRSRPAFDADERTQLLGWLAMQRAVIHWKCEGVSEEDAHRAPLPGSPLMTLAGLVNHLRWVEHLWFETVLLGGPAVGPRFEVEDGDFLAATELPLAQLLAEYREQCAKSDEIIAAHSLDDVGRNRDLPVGTATLRWILFHMIEETARHAGHADALREFVDGATGYY